MYSTWVSAWRVPLMKVTAETSGQRPCAPTIASAPSPFCTVITVAPANADSSRVATASRSTPLHATMTRSGSGSACGSVDARTRAVWPPRPLTRSPSRSSAAACSSRRVSTDTSQTRPR
jgi:hypothetical protein